MSEQHGSPPPNGATPVETNTTPPGLAPRAEPNWSEFMERFGEKLSDVNNQLAERLGGKLDSLNNTVTERVAPPAPAAPNYDEMTNSEVVAHMTASVQGMVEKALQTALQPLMDRITGVQTDLVTHRSTVEIQQMRERHKDFADWKDEMIGLAKANPSLGFQDLYILAKGKNPQKAQELELKYNPPPPPKARGWGGLLPGAPGANGAGTRMTSEQAAQAAYREVAERHPGVLPALETL